VGSFLTPAVSPARRLRELLAGPEPVLAPGAYDALSARLVEQAGFPAVYMTGFGAAASVLGRPDVGLVSGTEMADHARRLARAVGIPLIADADTGYGNPLNVIRTVQEYAAAGVAALHLEDQVAPKKCGHMTGKQVVPPDEMVQKIRAAVAARGAGDLVIIARTDARAVEGLEAALERARRYHDAGADVLFVEAPESEGEIERIARTFEGVPLLFNWVESGRTPPVPLSQLRAYGFKLVIFPVTTLFAATFAVRAALERLKADGTPVALADRQVSFPEFLDLIGLDEIRTLEARFAT
jgi:2-methylisocitrate lyase-like PEP mutase family enzyme